MEKEERRYFASRRLFNTGNQMIELSERLEKGDEPLTDRENRLVRLVNIQEIQERFSAAIGYYITTGTMEIDFNDYDIK